MLTPDHFRRDRLNITNVCKVLDDSTVKCWGSGRFGATGHGDILERGLNASDMGDNLLPVNLTFGRGDGLVRAPLPFGEHVFDP